MYKPSNRILFSLLLLFSCSGVLAQNGAGLKLQLPEEHRKATVELLRGTDSTLLRIGIADTAGMVLWEQLPAGSYLLRVRSLGYNTKFSDPFNLQPNETLQLPAIELTPANTTLGEVRVSAKKPFLEMTAGKTTINLDAAVTNIGTSVLEALEKMPGVAVDRAGAISLKGRSNVLVLIDDKPTYLNGADLLNLLQGMNSSSVAQVELMDQPPARYDAAGNGGIINIRTKKSLQRGFNGTANTALGHGRYAKMNNSLLLNYRQGKANIFLNYSGNENRNFMEMSALRTYQKTDLSPKRLLEQANDFDNTAGTHNIRTGIDINLTNGHSFGAAISGMALRRNNYSDGIANWRSSSGATDSTIHTLTKNRNRWKNGTINLNYRHRGRGERTLSTDLDLLQYRIRGTQFSSNEMVSPRREYESFRGYLPATISIISMKADYTQPLAGGARLEAGWKSSHIRTDNDARYDANTGLGWQVDAGKTNHFRYRETIHAAYGSWYAQKGRWTTEAGLRYEATSYEGEQLGNALQKGSSFAPPTYHSLFPTLSLQLDADSQHNISFTASRRIDRPAFQKLNPFVFILNKYTYQQGNPYFRPQFTWNMALNHHFRQWLLSGISYSRTDNYFSQIFFADSSGQVIYTEGNLGVLHNWGLSLSANGHLASWWTVTAQGVLNRKIMDGVIEVKSREKIMQFNASLSNQFQFKKGWSAELSGFYVSRSRVDLQELLDPAGQVSLGVSKSVLKTKGTLRAGIRDIFYTQIMQGYTDLAGATETFRLCRDSRVATLSFTYRFGKPLKGARRTEGPSDEVKRVGTGG